MKHNYEQLISDIANLRKEARTNDDSERHEVLKVLAFDLLTSKEFGNFLTLSTIYKQLEDSKP